MDSSASSDLDYAERVALQNNMDIDLAAVNAQKSDAHLSSSAPSQPHVPCEAAPINTLDQDSLSQPSTPDVIPYSANIPADPSLWDGNFGIISLFGTNEFLQSDVANMSISLQRMATFLRQRKLISQNGNSISQLDTFGEAAWSFLSAIYESGWDQLNVTDESSFRNM